MLEGVGTIDGRTWLEILSLPECQRLLETAAVGRVAFVVDGSPEVMPVNYVADPDGSIVFRTEKGTKLSAVLANPSVAFEVDETDPEWQKGWSVLVKGRAQEIGGAAELRRARELAVRPWVRGETPHWVRIVPQEVTGRRIRHGPEA
jgi:nitroimidazol reductase NimA-like FMN-containing flavoprotein (pyridoxamine 5'-phosphate oxidase superfamily)